jgi:hypothetical protein
MITDIFWNVATSTLALELDAVLLLAALIVGHVPFGKYMPVIGPYVPVARLCALLLALSMCFLLGFRVSNERDVAKNLRAELAAKQADLDIAAKSAADATKRATEIEKASNDRHQEDLAYIESLQNVPACLLDDPDIDGMRHAAFSGRAKSPRRAR